jgi:hypothetical protein
MTRDHKLVSNVGYSIWRNTLLHNYGKLEISKACCQGVYLWWLGLQESYAWINCRYGEVFTLPSMRCGDVYGGGITKLKLCNNNIVSCSIETNDENGLCLSLWYVSDLSGNEITSWPPTTFTNLALLQTLFVSEVLLSFLSLIILHAVIMISIIIISIFIIN